MSKVYLSKERYNKLEEELKELRNVKRKEVAEDLKYAKSLGDLSENAEYHEARQAQAILETRIQKLEAMLKEAEIVESHHSNEVEVGSTVVVKKRDNSNEEKTYEIVGSEESDMTLGKISNESPLGRAMLGKEEGDEFEFETPNGKLSYSVVKIK